MGISGLFGVTGILDLLGPWDANPAFVVVAAIRVYFVLHRLIIGRVAPQFDTRSTSTA